MSFKTPILCDRRVFTYKGKWKSPNNDIAENIFYYIQDPLTLTTEYHNGREEIKETMSIVVFGGKPIAQYDNITLDNGKEYTVGEIDYNYIEPNILVRDMLKPRVASMVIQLG